MKKRIDKYEKRDNIISEVTRKRSRKEKNMRNLSILIEEDLHRKVKIRAASKGETVKQYLLNLIEKDLTTEKRNS